MSESTPALEGKCQDCGAPGTLQHAPTPMPSSGVWCERCYGKLERRMTWWFWLYRFWWIPVAVALLIWHWRK